MHAGRSLEEVGGDALGLRADPREYGRRVGVGNGALADRHLGVHGGLDQGMDERAVSSAAGVR